MSFIIRFRPYVFVLALLGVGGCQTQSQHKTFNVSTDSPERYSSAESLLDSNGYWDLVEEKPEMSPVEQHMRARLQVNPEQVEGIKKYISYSDAPNEKTHFRILRLTSMEIVVPERKPERTAKGLNSELIVADLKLEKTSIASIRKPERKPERKSVKMVTDTATVTATVTNIRLGEHKEKTRFVLDLTGPSDFIYELNNEKGYLLIDLPGTAWATDTRKVFQSHWLLRGYSVRSNSEGTKILVVLKKPGRLITSVALPPDATSGHRIYFDVGAAR